MDNVSQPQNVSLKVRERRNVSLYVNVSGKNLRFGDPLSILVITRSLRPTMPTKPKFRRSLQIYFLSNPRRHTAIQSTQHYLSLTDYQEIEIETDQLVKGNHASPSLLPDPDQYGDTERSYSTH